MDNRKDANRDVNVFFTAVARDGAAVAAGNTVGNSTAGDAGFPARADFRGKANRFCNLNACFRQVPDRRVLYVRIVHREVGAENLNVAFAAVKDDLLVEDAEPLYTHWRMRKSRGIKKGY